MLNMAEHASWLLAMAEKTAFQLMAGLQEKDVKGTGRHCQGSGHFGALAFLNFRTWINHQRIRVWKRGKNPTGMVPCHGLGNLHMFLMSIEDLPNQIYIYIL